MSTKYDKLFLEISDTKDYLSINSTTDENMDITNSTRSNSTTDLVDLYSSISNIE